MSDAPKIVWMQEWSDPNGLRSSYVVFNYECSGDIAYRRADLLDAELAERDAACQAALRALDTYEAMYRHHMTVQLYSARAGLRDVLQNVDTLRGAKAKQTNHEKEMYRLLVWADALMRSMSGWPENHPNEYIEWKEDWRKLLEGN